MRSHPKFVFTLFSEKRKENELHRKYMLLGGPVENLSPPTILQIQYIKIDDFV